MPCVCLCSPVPDSGRSQAAADPKTNEQEARFPDPGRPHMVADPMTLVRVMLEAMMTMRMVHKPCRVSAGAAERLDKSGTKGSPRHPVLPTPVFPPRRKIPSLTRHHARPY